MFAEDTPLPPVMCFAMGTLGFLTPFDAAQFRSCLVSGWVQCCWHASCIQFDPHGGSACGAHACCCWLELVRFQCCSLLASVLCMPSAPAMTQPAIPSMPGPAQCDLPRLPAPAGPPPALQARVLAANRRPLYCTLRTRKRCAVLDNNGQLKRVHHILNECVVDR